MAENKVKDGNYITIQSFMVKDLQLKGNELLVYAIIYGFSQNGVDRFTGSLQYICDWTNITKQGVLNVLKSLVEKGLIEKIEAQKNGVKFVEYHTTDFTTIQKSLIPHSKKFNGGGKKSLPNNIDRYNSIYNSSKKERNSYINIINQYTDDDDTIEAIWKFIQHYQARQGRYILNDELVNFLEWTQSHGLLFDGGVLAQLNDDGIARTLLKE